MILALPPKTNSRANTKVIFDVLITITFSNLNLHNLAFNQNKQTNIMYKCACCNMEPKVQSFLIWKERKGGGGGGEIEIG